MTRQQNANGDHDRIPFGILGGFVVEGADPDVFVAMREVTTLFLSSSVKYAERCLLTLGPHVCCGARKAVICTPHSVRAPLDRWCERKTTTHLGATLTAGQRVLPCYRVSTLL